MNKKMDKRTACHMLADINEAIYDCENSLSDIESRLRWDSGNKEWYLKRKKMKLKELEKLKTEHDEFISKYSDIIYS